MNYEQELNNLKQNLEKNKSLKYRAEARLEQLNQQKEMLIGEIKSEGINPEDLEKEINKLQGEIESLFKEAEELMPRD